MTRQALHKELEAAREWVHSFPSLEIGSDGAEYIAQKLLHCWMFSETHTYLAHHLQAVDLRLWLVQQMLVRLHEHPFRLLDKLLRSCKLDVSNVYHPCSIDSAKQPMMLNAWRINWAGRGTWLLWRDDPERVCYAKSTGDAFYETGTCNVDLARRIVWTYSKPSPTGRNPAWWPKLRSN